MESVNHEQSDEVDTARGFERMLCWKIVKERCIQIFRSRAENMEETSHKLSFVWSGRL